MDDNRLWRLAQAGDRDAFAALFELHGNAVYRFCYRSSVDWSVAEDLTATVFLEAWRKLREVELGSYGARPWLLGVATNVVRNQRRALRRYRAALKRIPLVRPEADFAGDLDARIDAARQMLRLRPQIDALPRREREVLALLWEGLSIQEIASALSIPEPTVRTRMYRLRQRFRGVGAVDERGEFKSPEGVSLP